MAKNDPLTDEEREKILAMPEGSLDEFVHDLYSQIASEKNNQGAESQLDFLLMEGGPAWVRTALFDEEE